MVTGKCNDTRQVKTVGFSVSHVVDGSRRLFLFSTSHILPFSDFFEASTRAKKKEDKHVFRSHSERLVLLKPLNPPLLSAQNALFDKESNIFRKIFAIIHAPVNLCISKQTCWGVLSWNLEVKLETSLKIFQISRSGASLRSEMLTSRRKR